MRNMRDFMKPGRSVAVAQNGMAASSHPAATLAALDILRAGGNAVDAAIAAVALQGVIDPHMTGIGGDCFVLFSPLGGAPIALNGSGRSPAAVTLDHYIEQGLSAIPDDSVDAVTIAGTVDAWCRLSNDYGSKSLEEVFAPAINAAQEGFVVTPRVALDWARYAGRVAKYEPAAKQFLPSGRAPAVGDIISHPTLARTLRRIAIEGRAAFYEGEIAADMVACLRRLGGLHQPDDFAMQNSEYTGSASIRYRDLTLHECPPNGQGLAALLIAGVLDGFDLSDETLSDADRIHLLAEASKVAYRQRDSIVADPAFHSIDLDAILSDDAIAKLRGSIQLGQASDKAPCELPQHRDTVYVTVVDRERNAVSFINSLFFAFGSGIYEPKSGILLQNRGAGFNLKRGHPNAVGPRKRPLHTIIPGMVTQNGKTVMSLGVMGGQYQAAGHVHILSQITDRGDDVQQASDRPRSFCFDGKLSLEPTIPEAVRDDLDRRGHRTVWADEPIGGYQGIWIDHERGVLFGGSDHRKDGLALGY